LARSIRRVPAAALPGDSGSSVETRPRPVVFQERRDLHGEPHRALDLGPAHGNAPPPVPALHEPAWSVAAPASKTGLRFGVNAVDGDRLGSVDPE